MKLRGLLGILVMIILMTGCAGPVEGVVVAKDMDPSRTERYTTTERRSCGTETYRDTKTVNGKTQTTTRTRTKYCDYPITRTRNIPAQWQLNIRTDKGTTQWASVSRVAWDRTKIGDRVNTANMR